MTEEEYAKYFLKNEYYDILDTYDCFFSKEELFWIDVISTLDKILEENIMRM